MTDEWIRYRDDPTQPVYFKWAETEQSDEAPKLGIDNTMPYERCRDAQLLHDRLLYPLRKFINQPVIVGSWYRCPELNKAVGGEKLSLHLIGRAADIKVDGMSPERLMRACIDLALPFDSLINEYGRWLHVQIARDGRRPRLQLVTAYIKTSPSGIEKTHYGLGLMPVNPETRRLA